MTEINKHAHGAADAIAVALCGISLASSGAFAAPKTSVDVFFSKLVDTSIPALADIPAKMESGDVAAAEKIFADYVRANLRTEDICQKWIKREYSPRALSNLTAKAKSVMDYNLTSCGTPHHFADHKVVWESNPTYNQYKEWTWQLNRHSELTPLAEYYMKTGDEQAVTVWLDMMNSWFAQAPVPEKAGSHDTKCWRTIDAGIRAGCWIGQFAAMARSKQVTDEFITHYCISVWEHGNRLRKNTTSGNWLLIELTALMRSHLVYPYISDTKEWYEYSMKRLREEIERQVYPDGFQYELSTAYHGGVIGDFRGVAEFHERLGLESPTFVRENIAKMYEVYMYLCTPRFLTPNLNDGEYSFVPRHCAAALELYPDREDFRWFASMGRQGKPPDFLSVAMPYAGAIVFRDSWRPDALWAYLDASPYGHAHQHEDKLNFLLYAYGRQMLVEGGNYFYDTSAMRKYVTSTRAHNTIRIDGLDQSTWRTYRWRDEDIRKKADFEFSTAPERDCAKASFKNGYGPQSLKAVHERKVIFIKNAEGLPPFFVVVDRLSSSDEKPHSFEIMWHLSKCEFSIDVLSFTGDFGKGVGLFAATSDKEAAITDKAGQTKPELQGWLPIWDSGPHQDIPIPTPVVKGSFSGQRRIVTVIVPYRNGSSPISGVTASTDSAATTFAINLADGTERSFDEN